MKNTANTLLATLRRLFKDDTPIKMTPLEFLVATTTAVSGALRQAAMVASTWYGSPRRVSTKVGRVR